MNNLRALRIERNISQTALAKLAHISQPYLHDLELDRRIGKPETWARIAEALNVEVKDLLDDEDCQMTG